MNFFVRFLTIFTVFNGVGILGIKNKDHRCYITPILLTQNEQKARISRILYLPSFGYKVLFFKGAMPTWFFILERRLGNHSNKISQTSLTRRWAAARVALQ